QAVSQRTQPVAVEPVDAGGDDLDAVDLVSLRRQTVDEGPGEPGLEPCDLALQFFDGTHQLVELPGHLPRSHFEPPRRFQQSLLLTGDVLKGALGGHRLHPPHARSHAAFGDDLKHAQMSAGGDVGAAAKLDAVVADLDHPDPLAVLDRKSTRLNSSHVKISYAVFCLKKKT